MSVKCIQFPLPSPKYIYILFLFLKVRIIQTVGVLWVYRVSVFFRKPVTHYLVSINFRMRKRKPFFSRDCPGGKLAIYTTISSSTQEICCKIHIGPNPQSAFWGILRNFLFENKLKVSLHFQNCLNISDNPIFGNAEQFGLWGCDGIRV